MKARRLLNQNRLAEACVHFRRSLELEVAPGTLLNVAQCFEREGDPVQALETYEHALAAAQQQASVSAERREAYANAARRGISAQKAQLAELVVNVAPTPGLRVELAGAPIVAGAKPHWLRPGAYKLQASAPGRSSYEREILAAAGARIAIEIPVLEQPEPAARASESRPPEQPAAATAPHTQGFDRVEGGTPILPWILIGTGAAALTAGVVTGLVTTHKAGELEDNCPDGSCPSEEQQPGWQGKIDDSQRLALVTTVLWTTGLAALGAGVTLFVLSDEKPESPAPRVRAGCLGDGCGMWLRGAF